MVKLFWWKIALLSSKSYSKKLEELEIITAGKPNLR